MLTKILTVTTLAILALTLACGTADEPPAENPAPASSGAARTSDAMTPAGSGETAGGAVAGAETTGTSSPMTDNASAPLTVNPATGSQDAVPENASTDIQDAVPANPATQNQDAVPANPATGTQGTVPGQPAGQQQTTENSDTATNAGSVPAATLPPTPIPCSVLSGEMWLSEDFWSNADTTQVTTALDCGASVHASSLKGVMPLHLAARYSDDPAVLQFLLDNGADPDKKSQLGTPLILAAQYNSNPEFIQILLDNGADVETNINDNTPLQVAAEYSDNPAVIQALLDNGAEVEAGIDGWTETRRITPLRFATERNGNPEIAQALLDAGADLEATFEFYIATHYLYRWTRFHHAARFNDDLAYFESIIESTPHDYQHQDARLRAVRIVINNTPGLTGTPRRWRGTPLQLAAKYTDNPEVIQFLIDNGARVNEHNPLYIPLHYAAAYNHNPAVVQTLLDNGADINAVTNTEYGFPGSKQKVPGELQGKSIALTPLHLAVWFNDNPEVLQTLLENGAMVNAKTGRRNQGYSPLHLAAWNNENPAVVQTLLDYGANINEPSLSADNYNPLTAAVIYNKNPAVIQVLLDHGAKLGDFNEENCDKMSPEAKELIREYNLAPDNCTE